MKAARIVKPKEPLIIDDIPIPEPKDMQVLVRVNATGVCHSDLHLWEGGYQGAGGSFIRVEDRGVKFPLTPGHEISGTIEKVGEEAKGLAEGDKVLVYPWLGEGSCPACRVGAENLCDNPRSLGIFQDGGYAEYVLVPHAKYVVKLDKLEPEEAASLACSGLTAYNAIKNAEVKPYEMLVIVGAGGLGLTGIQLARNVTNARIAVIDLDDRRLEEAKRLGADYTINAKTSNPVKEIKDITNGLGADAVIDFVNASNTVATDLELLRKRGRLVPVGLFGGSVELALVTIPLRAIKIIGSYTGRLEDLFELVALAERGVIKTIISKRFNLDDANQALEELREGKIIGRAVIKP
jgi:propanol-preferring alcohol dehydrogenase